MAYAYHENRDRYFEHQCRVTEEYVIPFVEQSGPLARDARVLEIGCAEAGVLKAFLDRGSVAVGVDRNLNRLERGKTLLAEPIRSGRLSLLHQDAQELAHREEFRASFDLIVLKDVIEHVEDRPGLFAVMRQLLRPRGRIFLSFPPWHMPFGGHQQICRSRVLSRVPYLHLLPAAAYRRVLELFAERPTRIESLMATYRTALPTAEFESAAQQAGYRIDSTRFYLLNPMYSYRFGARPLVQVPWVSAQPALRDFVTTCAYYTIS